MDCTYEKLSYFVNHCGVCGEGDAQPAEPEESTPEDETEEGGEEAPQ